MTNEQLAKDYKQYGNRCLAYQLWYAMGICPTDIQINFAADYDKYADYVQSKDFTT